MAMKETWKMKKGECSLSLPDEMQEWFENLVNQNMRRSPSLVVQDFMAPAFKAWRDEKISEADKSIPPKSHAPHDMPIHTEARARSKVTRETNGVGQ